MIKYYVLEVTENKVFYDRYFNYRIVTDFPTYEEAEDYIKHNHGKYKIEKIYERR